MSKVMSPNDGMIKIISPNDIVPASYSSGWGTNKSTILADPARFMDSSSWDGEADFTVSIGDTSITEDTEGPFKSAKDADTNGVTRQEIITYRKRDGYLVKETAVRVFDQTDYTDQTASIVIAKF